MGSFPPPETLCCFFTFKVTGASSSVTDCYYIKSNKDVYSKLDGIECDISSEPCMLIFLVLCPEP